MIRRIWICIIIRRSWGRVIVIDWRVIVTRPQAPS
jgi:hypothetical protein